MTHNRKGQTLPGVFTLENEGAKNIHGHRRSPEERRRSVSRPTDALFKSRPLNLAEIVIAAKIYYGDDHGDDFDVRYFEVNSLPAGVGIISSIVNQCPVELQ